MGFIKYFWPEFLIGAAMMAFGLGLGVLAVNHEHGAREFRAACERQGGDAAFDGRKYQCLQRKGG